MVDNAVNRANPTIGIFQRTGCMRYLPRAIMGAILSFIAILQLSVKLTFPVALLDGRYGRLSAFLDLIAGVTQHYRLPPGLATSFSTGCIGTSLVWSSGLGVKEVS